MKDRITHEQEDDYIDIGLLLHDLFRGARKFWWFLITLIIIGVSAAFLYSLGNYKPMYQSQASFTVTTSYSENSNYEYSYSFDQKTATQMADTFPYILESELLTDMVKQDLDVDMINGSITASAVENSNLFSLTVTSDNPEDAKMILESVIKNYPTVSQYVIGDTMLNMIQAPNLPTEPYNKRNHWDAAAKGAAFGAVLGLLFLCLYALTRKTIRKEEEIAEMLNVQCLGIIPKVEFKKSRMKKNQELSIHNEKTGEFFHESIRAVALRLFGEMQKKNEKILMVTSTLPEEGTTSIARNLAYALSEMNKKVLFIDAGRKDKKERDVKYGLQQLLSGQCTAKEALVWKDGILYLACPNGFRATEHMTTSGSMKKLIRQLSKAVDYIIIDADSCAHMSETSLIAECSDTVLYVIKQDTAKTRKIMEGIEDLCGYGVSLTGCVLNQMQIGLSGYGYGKYYGKYSYNKYGYGKRYGYGRSYGDDYSKRD